MYLFLGFVLFGPLTPIPRRLSPLLPLGPLARLLPLSLPLSLPLRLPLPLRLLLLLQELGSRIYSWSESTLGQRAQCKSATVVKKPDT